MNCQSNKLIRIQMVLVKDRLIMRLVKSLRRQKNHKNRKIWILKVSMRISIRIKNLKKLQSDIARLSSSTKSIKIRSKVMIISYLITLNQIIINNSRRKNSNGWMSSTSRNKIRRKKIRSKNMKSKKILTIKKTRILVIRINTVKLINKKTKTQNRENKILIKEMKIQNRKTKIQNMRTKNLQETQSKI